jgi:taurine dioxygenase
MKVEKTSQYYGAYVHGLDFSKKIDQDTILELKNLWLKHQILIFSEQSLTPKDLENFVLYFGEYCKDPYILPIDGSDYVAEVKREKNEKTEIFAEGWHSDWFHMPDPPGGTALYAIEIPPVGGDTLFADLYESYNDLPSETKDFLEKNHGINSARRGYAPDARYGSKDIGRSMKLVYSDSAYETQVHPLSKRHPETGKRVINCNRGYTIGIKDMSEDESYKMLSYLFQHQRQERYIYRHKWKVGDLVLWDNRCLLHRATGGYDGYQRNLYRVTIK